MEIKVGGVWLIAFLVMSILKLANVITWSWWVVCSPLLISASLFLIGFLWYFAYAMAKARS